MYSKKVDLEFKKIYEQLRLEIKNNKIEQITRNVFIREHNTDSRGVFFDFIILPYSLSNKFNTSKLKFINYSLARKAAIDIQIEFINEE